MKALMEDLAQGAVAEVSETKGAKEQGETEEAVREENQVGGQGN